MHEVQNKKFSGPITTPSITQPARTSKPDVKETMRPAMGETVRSWSASRKVKSPPINVGPTAAAPSTAVPAGCADAAAPPPLLFAASSP